MGETAAKPQILIALGSPSDQKLLEGTKYPASADFYLGVASAHRTAERVATFASAREWDAVIAAAGFTNALCSAYMGERYADIKTLVFGVPLLSKDDNTIADLASLLSTTQLPPGVPIASIKTIQEAVATAAYFTSNRFNRVALLYVDDNGESQEQPARDFLTKYEVPFAEFSLDQRTQPTSTDVLVGIDLVNPSFSDKSSKAYRTWPSPDRPVLFCYPQARIPIDRLVYAIEQMGIRADHTALLNSPQNLAFFAAKILARSDTDLEARLSALVQEQIAKYRPHAGINLLNPGVDTT